MSAIKVSKAALWKAIHKNCLRCVGSNHWINICDSHVKSDYPCDLWPYRLGHSMKETDYGYYTNLDNTQEDKDNSS